MLDAAGISNFQLRAGAKTGICAHENRGVVDASVYKQRAASNLKGMVIW